jgi:hypothetical protein
MNTQTPVVEKPAEATPVVETPRTEPPGAEKPITSELETKEERTWTEEIELAGSQLVEQVKEWIAEGNVRRLILRTPDNSLVLEIPLMAGAVIGGVLTVFAPLLVVLGAVASVFAHVTVEIVRVEDTEEPTPKA